MRQAGVIAPDAHSGLSGDHPGEGRRPGRAACAFAGWESVNEIAGRGGLDQQDLFQL
jgi:hypothetical protein